uniref:PR/SET domain 2 n=2 Tax=Cynoglossus semilaevis TaxID=244447 RepID=A0A3P8X414_CYNSE
MWDGEEGLKEEVESSASETSQELQKSHPKGNGERQDVSAQLMDTENGEEEEEGEEDEEDEEEEEDAAPDNLIGPTGPQHSVAADSIHVKSLTSREISHKNSEQNLKVSQFKGQEPEVDPDLDIDPEPDGDLESDPHGESYPCKHCERHFSTKQGLERHIHIHGISNRQTQLFKCRYCSKSFGSQVGRRRHERRHESGHKKRPGSLAGTAGLLSPVTQTDGSSPDCTSPTGQYVAVGSQFSVGPLHNTELQRKELGLHADPHFTLDDNGESKELHPCKYCSKAFGTHTNMRRHQRRIHERHLLPKGVRRKGMLLQEAAAQQQQLPGESSSTSPPPVYMPSADTEDEVDRDDYAVDISKNISENLSFYIDGKIVSTNAESSCEVIEVDSRSATLFGLDTVIISPNQFGQTLKVEGRQSGAKQVSNTTQAASKRRTSTPPSFVPSLKVETESSHFTASSSSSSSTSSSSNLIVGGLFQPASDTSPFLREKTVYLSPKLKQLLQTQDIQKSTITLITESHRLVSPLSVTQVSGSSARFKRRTSSPPSSPQLSPASKTDSCKAEVTSPYTLKVPKLENLSLSPSGSVVDKDDGDTQSPSGKHQHSPAASSGGHSCNQQPLDLSNSIIRKNEILNKVPGDSALDLSLTRKLTVEPEVKGNPGPQPLIKKRKPNTSMLEKVLMNEYVGLTVPGEESSSVLANMSSFHSLSPSATSESAHPSPPSLTPVTMNPSSPGTSSVTSPTPPPPVLPTVPSPLAVPGSPTSQPSPLPVLFPKMSPRSPEHQSDSEDDVGAEEEERVAQSSDSPVTDNINCPSPSPPQSPSQDVSVHDRQQNGSLNQDSTDETSLKPDSAALLPQTEPSSSSHSPSQDPAPTPSLHKINIKEEPQQWNGEVAVVNNALGDDVDASPQPAAPRGASEKAPQMQEVDGAYGKTFVCNVCEEPFSSIKELSGHIIEHAADWPFKCEFCVQLFSDAPSLLAHRTTLHGVGNIFVCSVCSKEFAFLCNLQQHQKDLHPDETCSNTTVESGKLRPQNYTDPSRAKEESSPSTPAPEVTGESVALVEPDVNGNLPEEEEEEEAEEAEDPNEELYTTIKIMASGGGKPKGPDVRLGINQHYPSYKPPPFPYHSRSHASSVASATNFTTHNIPQTFSTAIRCTKCGNSFDNMPELHQHILACANASDKKRYTPKKNPIPLKQIVNSPNGAVSPTAAAATAAGQSPFRRMGQPKRLNFNQDAMKTKMSALSKKKNQLVQKAISQKNKASTTAKKVTVKKEEEPVSNVCPHCSREFTYPASLSKHMAVSCPKKPAVTKGKKGPATVKREAERAVSLRKKSSEPEIQQIKTEPKTLGKTRTRSSSAANPEPVKAGKGRTAAPLGQLKRPAPSPATASASKKTKKGQLQSLPPPLPAPDTSVDAAPQQTPVRTRVDKDAAPKKSAETKPAPLKPQQLKKEERFALRTRERVGGPVTRRSQMSSTAPPAEGKSEEPPVQDSKETQETLTK